MGWTSKPGQRARPSANSLGKVAQAAFWSARFSSTGALVEACPRFMEGVRGARDAGASWETL